MEVVQPPDIAKPWSNIETTFLRGPPTPQDNTTTFFQIMLFLKSDIFKIGWFQLHLIRFVFVYRGLQLHLIYQVDTKKAPSIVGVCFESC